MATPPATGGAGSSHGRANNKTCHKKSTSCMHYLDDQITTFEAIYIECPHPSASQRMEMKCMFPILSEIDDKEIKTWFENRRSSDKLKKESYDLHWASEKLKATNKFLKVENEALMKRVTELLSENSYLKQKLQDAC